MRTKAQLIEAATRYSEATGISLARLSKRVLNDGKFFVRLVNAAHSDCTTGNYDKVMAYMRATWPKGVKMPDAVARAPKRGVAA